MTYAIAGAMLALGVITAMPADTVTVTIDGTDYPVCSLEDCSDQPAGVGAWQDSDTGRWYLITPSATYPVVR